MSSDWNVKLIISSKIDKWLKCAPKRGTRGTYFQSGAQAGHKRGTNTDLIVSRWFSYTTGDTIQFHGQTHTNFMNFTSQPVTKSLPGTRDTKIQQPNRQMTEMCPEAGHTGHIFSKRGTSGAQAGHKTWSRSLTWKRVKAANPTKFSLFQRIHGPGDLAVNVCAREEIQCIYFPFYNLFQNINYNLFTIK